MSIKTIEINGLVMGARTGTVVLDVPEGVTFAEAVAALGAEFENPDRKVTLRGATVDGDTVLEDGAVILAGEDSASNAA